MNFKGFIERNRVPSLKEILATEDYQKIRSWVLYEVTGWCMVGFMFGSLITVELMRRGIIPL